MVNELTDADDRLTVCQKVVYGEVESEHRYDYGENGRLKSAVITDGGEVRELSFD